MAGESQLYANTGKAGSEDSSAPASLLLQKKRKPFSGIASYPMVTIRLRPSHPTPSAATRRPTQSALATTDTQPG